MVTHYAPAVRKQAFGARLVWFSRTHLTYATSCRTSGIDNIKWYSCHWSPIFRTDVFGLNDEEQSRPWGYAGWGISPYWKHYMGVQGPKIRLNAHDGDACAVIYHFDGNLAKLEMFEHHVLKTPYLLLERPDVLVIGVGGGTDIVNAIKQGAAHVTGVELDPITVEVVRRDHASFVGHLYDRPEVTIMAGEGRSSVRHSDKQYDLVQLSGVDTLAALSTGAYILSESYLYTTEAVHDFLNHLTPGGILSFLTADAAGELTPRHSLRQLALFIQALHERGIEDPENRVAVVASAEGMPMITVLLKNGTFTVEESQRLQDFADRMGFNVWARPGAKLQMVHSRVLGMPPRERTAFLAQTPLIFTPTTDDNPFFFNYYRWRNLWKNLAEMDVGHTLATGQIVLRLILLFSIVFSSLLILLPLIVFQRQGLRTPRKWGFICYFVAIGLGFMLIEISFIQKFVLFLGYPTYALTVVLFSLLTYAGLGSWLTGRMTRPPEDRFTLLLVGLAIVSLLHVVALPPLFRTLLGSSLPLRVVVASTVLIPLGLLMGMFFPSGIQIVRRINMSFVPWAWGINGCASVVGAVLAVILAMSYGFRFVTLVALTVCGVGVVAMKGSAKAVPTENL